VGRPAGLFRPAAVLALAGLRDGGYALVSERGVFRVGLDGRVAQAVAVTAVGVAELPDGALVYTTNRKVRRLGRDGTVSTLLVLEQQEEAEAITAGADGSVYFGYGSLVRRIDPGGAVSTVAGSEDGRDPASGGVATDAEFDGIAALAVTTDGALLISDRSHIWRVGREGRLRNLGGGAQLEPRAGRDARRVAIAADTLSALPGGGFVTMGYGSEPILVGRDGRVTRVIETPTEPRSSVHDGDGLLVRELDRGASLVAAGADGGLLMSGFRDVIEAVPSGSRRLGVALGPDIDARTTRLRVPYRVTRRARLRFEILSRGRVVARRGVTSTAVGSLTFTAPLVAGRRYTLRVRATAGRAVAIDQHHFYAGGLLSAHAAERAADATAVQNSGDGAYLQPDGCERLARTRFSCEFDWAADSGVGESGGSAVYTLARNGRIAERYRS
jgi:hypothetical protein